MSTNHIRVSDGDRARVVDRIATAAAEGRLSIDEADERTAAAYQARYESELGPLTEDLPAPLPARSARRRPPIAVFVVIAAVLTAAWWHSGAHFFWPVIPLAFIAIRLGLAPWAWRPWARVR